VCKNAKKDKQVAQSKQGKHNIIAQSEERCVSSTPTSQRCVSQAVTSKQIERGTDATTQASGPKDQQAQAHERHKTWKRLDLDRQHMHKGNDPNPLILAWTHGCKPRP